MLRSRADIALILLGIVVFVIGAVVLARPFVTRRLTLFVAVPAAATAGIAVLGVIALVCAAVIVLLESPDNVGDLLSGISWPSVARTSVAGRRDPTDRRHIPVRWTIDAASS